MTDFIKNLLKEAAEEAADKKKMATDSETSCDDEEDDEDEEEMDEGEMPPQFKKKDKEEKSSDEEETDDEDEEDEDDEEEMDESIVSEKLKAFVESVTVVIPEEKFASLNEGIDAIPAEFMAKAKTMFEEVCTAQVRASLTESVAAMAKKADEAVIQIAEGLNTQIDKYATEVAREWISENQLAVDTGINAQINASLVESMQRVFSEHFVSVPENRLDIVEALRKRLNVMEESLSIEMDQSIALRESASLLSKKLAVAEHVRGMSAVAADKVVRLAESLMPSAASGKELVEQLKTLTESVSVKDTTSIVENVPVTVVESSVPVKSSVSHYAEYLKNSK